MKLERTKNATRNMAFGVLLKLYQIAVPFLLRTVMIYLLGVEYVGLNGLFTSILQVLNLAELGAGGAMIFSMYQPIIDDDTQKICALMQLYKVYYRIIGTVILVAGLALTPVVPYLIKAGTLPTGINVYVLYLLNLGATVLSYWLFAYKNSLLTAHQRNDVTSKITLVINTVQYGLQILFLFLFKNYYYFVIITLVMQAVNNIVTALVVNKMYPQYKAVGKVSDEERKKINGRVRDLFTSKIGGVIVNSSDSIVISIFLGAAVLGVYSNYFLILTSVKGFVDIIFTACTAGIGNSLLVESKEKNFADFQKFTFIISWIAGFCTACFLCLYQPFMEIWVGTQNQLGFTAVICFSIYFFVQEINTLFNSYKDAAGMWHEDRWRPLIVSLANLCMNLIMVQFWGIYGVLLSTVLATLVVGMPWLTHNLFTVIFPRKELKGFLKKLLLYTAVVGLACVATYLLAGVLTLTNVWAIFFVRMGLCIIIPNIIFLLVYHRTNEFKETVRLFDRITKGKLKLSRFLDGKKPIEKAVDMVAPTEEQMVSKTDNSNEGKIE